jgi:hypothetical protein
MAVLEVGVDIAVRAPMATVRAKSLRQSALLMELVAQRCADAGLATRPDQACWRALGSEGNVARYILLIETAEAVGSEDNQVLGSMLRMIAHKVQIEQDATEYRDVVREDIGHKMGRYRLIRDE